MLKLSESEIAASLSNKNVLIVGGTSGIGKALAESCLERDAKVTIIGRRTPDTYLAAATFVKMDLQLMKNVDQLSKDLDMSSFDIIVFTNGVVTTPEKKETEEGLEMDLAISYLSRLRLLKNTLKSIGQKRRDMKVKPRVFVMGAPGPFAGMAITADLDDFNSERSYKQIGAHMNTVIGNEALVNWLADANPSINVFGLNPGVISTDIRSNFGSGWFYYIVEWFIRTFFQSAKQYSENVLIHLLVSSEFEEKSKALFGSNGALLSPNPFVTSNQDKIMTISEDLLKKI